MATVTAGITLTSGVGDLLTDALALSDSTSITAANTSGLARKTLTSISKTNRISCLDGDAAIADATVHEGQYIDITDNHGLKKRYVIIDGSSSTVATGDIIASGTDLGSDTAANLGLLQTVGGIAVDVPNTTTQAATLNLFKTAIEHANGHNGSISVASATVADGVQEIVLTNGTSGESGAFLVDIDNSTITVFLDNTKDAEATNSALEHPILVNKSEFTSPAYAYIKNTAAYHASNGRVFLYYDNHGAEEIMEIRGGAFAFIPLNTQNNLRAYTSTSGTIVEYMVFGTNA